MKDKLICSVCKGENIQTKAWVSVKDKIFIEDCPENPFDNWCEDCGKHVDFEKLNENE